MSFLLEQGITERSLRIHSLGFRKIYLLIKRFLITKSELWLWSQFQTSTSRSFHVRVEMYSGIASYRRLKNDRIRDVDHTVPHASQELWPEHPVCPSALSVLGVCRQEAGILLREVGVWPLADVAEGSWDVQTASLAGAGEGSVAALLAFLPSVAQNGVLDEDEGFGNGKVKFWPLRATIKRKEEVHWVEQLKSFKAS